jgi:hypothetical protein
MDIKLKAEDLLLEENCARHVIAASLPLILGCCQHAQIGERGNKLVSLSTSPVMLGSNTGLANDLR